MYLLIYLLVEKYKKFIGYLPPVEIGVPVDMVSGGKKIVPDFALAGVLRAVYSSWSFRCSKVLIAASIASLSMVVFSICSDTSRSSSLMKLSTSYGSI